MASVDYEIEKLQYLTIGQQGESNATQINIDMSAWVEELSEMGYDNPVFHLLFMPYNAVVPLTTNTSYDADTKILTWTVTDSDTAHTGLGYTEIRALNHPDNGLLKKSSVIPTTVNTSVTGVEGGVPPAPYDDWLNSILILIGQLNNALNGAVTSYALSNSYTEAPTTGWSETMPDLVTNKGKYLWSKTTINWSTGGQSELYNISYIALDTQGAVVRVNGYDGNVVLDGGDIQVNRLTTGSPTLAAAIDSLTAADQAITSQVNTKLDAAKIVYSSTAPTGSTGMIWLKPKA